MPSWKWGYVKGYLYIQLLFIHAKHGYDTTIHPYEMSKVMNNLILGECVDTFIDVNSTWRDVFEGGGLIMKLLTYGNDTAN